MVSLIEQIHSDSKEQRVHAIEVLGQQRNFDAKDELIDLIRDEQESLAIKEKAIIAVSQILNVSNVEKHLAHLKSADESISLDAIDSFITIATTFVQDPQKLQSVLINLKHDNPEVVLHAVEDIARSKEYRVKESLAVLKTMISHQFAKIRTAVIDALGNFEVSEVLDVIENSLSDANEDVRAMAIRVLAEKKQENSLNNILSGLNDTHWRVRANTVEALRDLNFPNKIELLIKHYADTHEAVRCGIVDVLDYSDEKIASQILIPATEDPHWRVRIAAIRRLTVPEHTAILEKVLAEDKSERVRCEALKILHMMQYDLTTSVEALNDLHSNVRLQAVINLYDFDISQTVTPLLKGLNDDVIDVSQTAGVILSRLGETLKVQEHAINSLGNEDWKKRKQAAYTLEKVGDENAIKPLMQVVNDKIRDVRKQAISALGALGDNQLIPVFLKALEDNDPAVKIEAILALEKLKAVEALSFIKKIAEHDLDDAVKHFAKDAVEKIQS